MHLVIHDRDTDKVEIINIDDIIQIIIHKPRWINYRIRKDGKKRLHIDLS